MARHTAAVASMAVAGLVVLLSATPVAAQERKDLQVFRDITERVQRYTAFTIFDNIEASVTEGAVVLEGWVTMPYKRDDIDRRVRAVDGVASLENRIQVLPVSPSDDELRYRIARAIYGNASFWHYAAMANPPIHIVVNRGHVTLAGVVQSQVERSLARSLATGFATFDVRNELRTDDEVKLALERIGS